MKFLILIFALNVLKITSAKVNRCGSSLLDDCFCGDTFYETKKMFIVNCTGLGFRDTRMLEQLPEEVEVLIFTGNHIDTLPSNVFGEDSDLSKLKYIDMSNNGIKDIKGKAFHHVLSVTRLILNHNDISISEDEDKNYHHPRVFSNFLNLEELHLTNAFADNTDSSMADDLHDIFVNSNLTKLYKLHLEQNEIKNFRDERVFCDLPNLHDIHLADNNIPNLNFRVDCLPKIRYLDLQDNNISRFSQRDFDTFDGLTRPYRSQNFTLEIERNPFRCDSSAKTLYSWILKTNVVVKHWDRLQCFARDGKKSAVNLKFYAESKYRRISQALTVLLVILVFILMTLLFAYAYLKKDSVKNRLSPLFDVVTRKVHYTTIESQDV